MEDLWTQLLNFMKDNPIYSGRPLLRAIHDSPILEPHILLVKEHAYTMKYIGCGYVRRGDVD
jgi:hypothetical protein